MIGTTDSNRKAQALQSSFYGTLRGITTEILVYPLQVVKIRQQCLEKSEKNFDIAKQIFREGGAGAFYKGLSPELFKTSIRQVWVWPLMTEMPKFFKEYGFKNLEAQILTGLSIATVDAIITAPLEKAKVFSALTGKSSSLGTHVSKNGWQGFSAYWMKRSVGTVTFLTAQAYFRDRAHSQSDSLDYLTLIKIGIQVAFVLSIISAPFDLANTVRQACNRSLFLEGSQVKVLRLYRGWPIYALSLVIQSVASVILMEKLSHKK